MTMTRQDSLSLKKQWTERPARQDPPTQIAAWARDLGISEWLARLLWSRGMSTPGEMDVFLSPGLRHLVPPEQWPGLENAAQTLAGAAAQGKTLAVWGDYDVDGVTSTAMVIEFFRTRGHAPLYHIPRRDTEGYGLNIPGIEALREKGAEILLTVDCGITNCAEIARARDLGMTVIVTDHHTPGPKLPHAHAVFNPRLGDCPCPDLAGVGAAFMLLAAANRLLPGEPLDMRNYLDLVALGTLADVVTLRGLNRVLVKNGLLTIAEAARPGVYALKEAAGYNPLAPLGTGQVSFGLAPRINAAGRMDDASLAVKMLLAPDIASARPPARKLDSLNSERQNVETMIMDQARDMALAQGQAPGLVLYSPDWPSGVIGIVASRMVEMFYRPTLMLTDGTDGLKGSGRGIREMDLYRALSACQDLFTHFGGHRQAAGFSLPRENLDDFKHRFNRAVAEQIGEKQLSPTLFLDGDLGFDAVDYTLLKELDLMQPFGPGNPEPVFSSGPVEVKNLRIFGAGHVGLEVMDIASGTTLQAKAWRQADTLTPDFKGRLLRLAFTPKLNQFNGLTSIELHVKDWRQA